jgi:alpha-beta hydrolase superfamily lysophospholipase
MIRSLAPAFAVLLLLGACAPLVQQAGRPEVGFTGPRIEAHDFVSFDGTRLALQTWEPSAGEPWAVVIGLHGMDDYANAFHLAAPYWAQDGIATLAYDQRGFGRSPGRGVWAGPELMTEDLRTLTALARQRYPHALIAVAGESMGAAVAIAAFASDRPPAADRLILVSPAVWGWSSQPLPYSASLWLLAHVDGGVVLNPPRFLENHIRASDNIDELRRMGRDPLMLWGSRTDTLYGLVALMQTAAQDAGATKIPALYLIGAHDQIIPLPAHYRAAKRLNPGDRTAIYADGWHLLLIDRQAEVVWRDIEGYIRDPAAPLASNSPPIPGAPTSAPSVEASR